MLTDFNLKNIENLKKDDMLIYDGKKFDIITKSDLIKNLEKNIIQLNSLIFNQNKKIAMLEENLDLKINRLIKAMRGEIE